MSFEFSSGLFPPLLSSMREAVVLTDAEANIIFVNPAFERDTGYSAGEVLGCNPRILKSTRQDTAFYRAMWQTLFTKGEWHGTVINRCKNGTLLQVEQRILAISQNGEITHFLSIWQNVTDAAQFQEKLFNFEKNQQVGRAAGSIAHDFNNILSAIVGFAKWVSCGRVPIRSQRPISPTSAALPTPVCGWSGNFRRSAARSRAARVSGRGGNSSSFSASASSSLNRRFSLRRDKG